LNNLNSDNAFWIEITKEEKSVACIAAHLYSNERLLDLIMSRRLWRNRPGIDAAPPIPVESIRVLSMIEGDLTIHSGMFVDPHYRGLGLSTALMHLIRASSFRAWHEDWQFGLLTTETNSKNIHRRKFGYPHQTLCIHGFSPWGPRHDMEYLTYVSKQEILAEYSVPASSAEMRRSTTDAM
jgi:GNAT superfamily N-acetyltransferase